MSAPSSRLNATSIWNATFGILAMLTGLGLIVFDMSLGLLNAVLGNQSVILFYIPPFILSIWGLKTFIAAYWPSGNAEQQRIPTTNVFHLPKEGVFYLVIMFMFFVGSIIADNNMLQLVFCVMVGPFIVNGGVSFGMLQRISLRRKLPERVMAGVPLTVELVLQNNKWLLPLFLMSARDRIEGPGERLEASVLYSRVPRKQYRVAPYQLRLLKRGVYRFGPCEVSTRFPLGITERGQVVKVQDQILVYPRLGILSGSWKRQLRGYTQVELVAAKKTGAADDEFHHIREYRSGDDPRAIHWKTSARRNELMVREYREMRDRDINLILDLRSRKKGSRSSLTENAVSLAATIAIDQIRVNGEVSLDFYGTGAAEYKWPRESEIRDLDNLLDLFAVVESGSEDRLEAILSRVSDTRGTNTRTVVISTRSFDAFHADMDDRKILERLEGFQWVHAEPESTRAFFQLQ